MTINNEGSPPREAMKLAAFIGEWKVEGTLEAGDDVAAISGLWRFVRAVDGWGVQGIMETTIEGMGTFQESELIGFDAAEQKIHLFSMNMYAIRDHTGDWADEDRLVVRYTGDDDGKLVVEEITIEFPEPDRMTGRVVEKADGELMITTELAMERPA